jgi:selenide,water dikinase
MNIVCFPAKEMDKAILKQILKGGVEIIHEAGAVLVGGHSVEDPEIKYGLSVTGLVHPDRVLTNAGARPDDSLVLTKPLGTGIIATAIKAAIAPAGLEEKIISIMGTLNKRAAEIMEDFQVNACTDISGFGLLGHALEIARGSRVEIHLWSRQVPVLPEALEFAAMGLLPEGSHANRNFCAKSLQKAPKVDAVLLDVLADAQTSGGLLISSPQGQALCRALQENGVPDARIIGKVAARHQRGMLKVF